MANFGAFYNPTASQITFRVFSASATRVELWIYAQATGAPENMRIKMVPTASNAQVFAQTVTVADLMAAEVTGTVYYGYRAWGPNWVFDPSWSPGSAAGFIADCDAAGNRFNPNKLLLDPYTRESSHDPLTPAANDASVYNERGYESAHRQREIGAESDRSSRSAFNTDLRNPTYSGLKRRSDLRSARARSY